MIGDKGTRKSYEQVKAEFLISELEKLVGFTVRHTTCTDDFASVGLVLADKDGMEWVAWIQSDDEGNDIGSVIVERIN